MLDINDNNWIERIPCSVRDILVARQLLTKYTKHCLKKPIVIPLSRKIFKKPRHRPDSMCQLPPKKPNIEEKKPKSQTIFWRQLPLIKAKFVKFGVKKANLATLPSYCCQQSAFFVTVAVTRGHFLCGVERVKRFVNVHLHCIVSNLKRISIVDVALPGKICADTHVRAAYNQGPFTIKNSFHFLLTFPSNALCLPFATIYQTNSSPSLCLCADQ